MARVLYTDIDPVSMQWIKALVREQLLPDGDCVTTDIANFDFDLLDYYPQCHFFAGIGGWPLALSMAGVPTGWKVWTGICPCQPFSVANMKPLGEKDERHVWPYFKQAIDYGKPTAIFGEQVASQLGRSWFSRVRPELEVLGYGVGAADISAAGVGLPHSRQRIYFVAYTHGDGLEGLESGWEPRQRSDESQEPATGGLVIQQRDKFEPSSLPLLQIDGVSRQLAIDVLEGFGNAIVPQLGAEFVRSSLEAIKEVYGNGG